MNCKAKVINVVFIKMTNFVVCQKKKKLLF